MGSVGIIVNPWAGKDVRRLHAPVGHTPDTAKIGIVRRVAIGALDAGADRVYVSRDVGRIAERAVKGVDGAELVDGPSTGSPLDTRRAAAQMADLGCAAVAVLGGDGTSRDVTMGWRDVPMIPISTGTNNVFPGFVDGSSAGTAAGLVACGLLALTDVAPRAKLLTVDITMPSGDLLQDIALVDVGVIDDHGTGARAVVKPGLIRMVVAALAVPASTGLSAIAGRTRPIAADEDGGVVVRLGGTHRYVRVPIIPGSFDVLPIESIDVLPDGGSVRVDGPCVLAYDGERDRVLPAGAAAVITVSRTGPYVIDVARTLRAAAERHLFDAPAPSPLPESVPAPRPTEASHGH